MKYANVLVCAGGERLFCFSLSRWAAEQIGQVMNFSSHLHFFVALTWVCVRRGGASLAKCHTGSGEEADRMSFASEKIQYTMLRLTCCYQLASANSANNNNNGSGHLAFATCRLISNVTSFSAQDSEGNLKSGTSLLRKHWGAWLPQRNKLQPLQPCCAYLPIYGMTFKKEWMI